MSQEWLLDIQSKGEQFLLKLFEMTKGDPAYLVPFGEVIDGWGWTDDECKDVADYLTSNGFIKRVGIGTLATRSYSITRHGRRWAEKKLQNSYGSIEPSPATGPLDLIAELRFRGSPFLFSEVFEVFDSLQSYEKRIDISVGFPGRHPDANILKSDISIAIPERRQIGRIDVLKKPQDLSIVFIYSREAFSAIVVEWWAPIYARMDEENYIIHDSEPTTDAIDSLVAIEKIISDKALMCNYYDGYSVSTAIEIVEAFPRAWELHVDEETRWGPGVIGKKVSINSTTVGRYLKAFRLAGITHISGIKVPYRPKN